MRLTEEELYSLNFSLKEENKELKKLLEQIYNSFLYEHAQGDAQYAKSWQKEILEYL